MNSMKMIYATALIATSIQALHLNLQQTAGSPTQEQLDRVHIHDGSSPNGSKLKIANGASGPMWINYQAPWYPWPQTLRIESGQTADYTIPSGNLPSVRFWPKYDCDADGQNCRFGESGGPGLPCPADGCSPPIDSKFEATFEASDGQDWYDSSQVDGWTLPYHMEYDCQVDATQSGVLDCTTLTEATCPSQHVAGAGDGEVSLRAYNPSSLLSGDTYAGCYSPCGLLTYTNWQSQYGNFKPYESPADQYCCAGDYSTPDTCWQGAAPDMTYTQTVHAHCNAYAWAYDDAVGLKACRSDSVSYSITFYDP